MSLLTRTGTESPNQPVERMAAGGRYFHIRTSWAAAIAHFLRSAALRAQWLILILIGLASGILAVNTASAQPITNYFLVAEWPSRVFHNDSYVIALTNAQDTAHARDLIVRGPAAAGRAIVVAYIAAGADGLNRNLRSPDAKPWSWHVTQVIAFADYTIEILDGYPGGVESDVPSWIQNTGGEIGFSAYTVVAELPLMPRVTAITPRSAQIELSLADLTPPFGVSVEASTNLAAGSWLAQTNFVPTTMATNILFPKRGDKEFYRVRTP